jgi:predicted PurR-regulated permease PerM
MDKESLIPKVTASSLFFSLASLTLLVFSLIYFEGIFKPLVIALIVWLLIKYVKDLLGKISIKGRMLPSSLRTILAMLVILGILYGVVELLIRNIEDIIASTPEYLRKFDETYNKVIALINNPEFTDYLKQWINNLNLGGMAGTVLNSISGIISDSAVVLVYAIFFLLEEATVQIKIDKLFPVKGHKYNKFLGNMQKVNQSIRTYLVSKTLISIITGVISYVILLLLKIDYAFLWSFLIFILNYIPYVGPLISSLIPAIFAVLIKGELIWFVYVFAAMEGVQIILGNFVEPTIMGKTSNLSPIIVIVALSFWGLIWGVIGMILAVPVTSVIVIGCSQIPSTRYLAILLSEKGDIPELED